MEINTYIQLKEERISVKETAAQLSEEINHWPDATFFKVTELASVFSLLPTGLRQRVVEERTIYINKNEIVKLIPNNDGTKQ